MMTARRPPRRTRPIHPARRAPARARGGLVLVLAAASAPGCSFDSAAPSGQPGDDQPDASSVDTPDSGPPGCDGPIQTQLLIGGQSPSGGGDPLVTVLLGESVVLSAAGSCTGSGTITYQWDLDPVLADTADPASNLESFTVYPTLPGDYSVTLTVGDGTDTDEPVTVVGIRAIGWQPVADGLDVRDVAIGAGRVWIASNLGPRFVDLDDVGAGAQDVNALAADDEEVPNDLSAVLFDRDANLVWFGRRGQDSAVWRLDVAAVQIDRVAFPTAIGQTTVRDISEQGTGVSVATEEGVTVAPDNLVLADPVITGGLFAVGENVAGGWAGANNLIRLSDQQSFTPFGAGDNKIRALAGDDDRLWIGGDDKGVARFNTSDLATDLFDEDDGLPSKRVRSLAVDSARDVWAATQDGAARYKRDIGVWVPMGEDAGLGNVIDLVAAAAADEGGDPVVVVGSNMGIAILGP